jgi:hypothetical protein
MNKRLLDTGYWILVNGYWILYAPHWFVYLTNQEYTGCLVLDAGLRLRQMKRKSTSLPQLAFYFNIAAVLG